MMADNLRRALVLSAVLNISTVSSAQLIEEWIEPVVDLQLADGSWKVVPADVLPTPPVRVIQEDANRLMVNIRRTGLVWIGRSSARLSDETLLLSCQKSQSARSSEYQNFGMRGAEQSASVTCISEE